MLQKTSLLPEEFYNKLESSSILVYNGHGGSSADIGTYLLTNPYGSASDERLFSSEAMRNNPLDLSDTDFIMFAGCQTSNRTGNPSNLPQESINCGAKAALGFEKTISTVGASSFSEKVFQHLKNGDSLYDACKNASCRGCSEFVYSIFYPNDPNFRIQDYHLLGNTSLTLC